MSGPAGGTLTQPNYAQVSIMCVTKPIPELAQQNTLNPYRERKFSRLTQLRTGHAFIGQYYRRFVPTEAVDCSCGDPIETRLHILQECPLYEEWQHLLNNDENQFSLAEILGTDDGATRVTSFLEASGAYEKKPRNETVVEQDEYDDPQ